MIQSPNILFVSFIGSLVLSGCEDSFVYDTQFINQYSTYLYASLSPGSGGLGECSLWCLLHNECHFYALNHGYCVFGDFRQYNTHFDYNWDDWPIYRSPASFGLYQSQQWLWFT